MLYRKVLESVVVILSIIAVKSVLILKSLHFRFEKNQVGKIANLIRPVSKEAAGRWRCAGQEDSGYGNKGDRCEITLLIFTTLGSCLLTYLSSKNVRGWRLWRLLWSHRRPTREAAFEGKPKEKGQANPSRRGVPAGGQIGNDGRAVIFINKEADKLFVAH